MKKQWLFPFLLFGTVIGVGISCRKDSFASANSSKTSHSQKDVGNDVPGVSTDGQMLVFNSDEDYENVVSVGYDGRANDAILAIEQMKFERYADQSVAKTTYDDFNSDIDATLARLLNKNGAIQIGQYIYKVDVQKDSVFAIDARYKESNYQDLIDGNTNNKRVVGFSTDEEVLDVVYERMTTNSVGEKKKNVSKIVLKAEKTHHLNY